MIRYISPVMAGFTFSASWGEDDAWGVALRYANEFNGIRIAAGVGYRESADACAGFAGDDDDGAAGASQCAGSNDQQQFGTSASVMHVPTGLYLTGHYGKNEASDFGDGSVGGEDESWFITAGVKRKFFAVGATNFYGKYGDYERGIDQGDVISGEIQAWGLGINQKIDSAAMEVYVAYDHIEAEAVSRADGDVSADVDAVIVGARIRF